MTPRREQKTQYITSAAEAAAVSGVRRGYVATFAPRLIEWGRLQPTSTIVDVPCGTGEMSRAISDRGIGRRFHLVDINEHMLKTAGQAMPENKAVLTRSDAADIGTSVPPGVDAILTLNGFHIYIDGKQQFLAGSRRILNEGGRLVFDVSTLGIGADSVSYLDAQDEAMRRMAADLGSPVNLPVHADQALLDTYADMTRNSGLELADVVYVRTEKPVHVFNDETIAIPGRLRSRFPQLTDEQRKAVFLGSSQEAVEATGVEALQHTRAFYIAEKVQ